MKEIKITIFGAEEKCASCIHLPSAYETMEWLEAAITRKFPDREISFKYCDIENANYSTDEEKRFSEMILNDEYFYPLVVLNGEVIAEGNPHLSSIYKVIENM
ncbi:YuzD family protein [Evansella cellulosilytica]|uniref:Uncharacterized conserved protein UCP010603 n=1 Tax=Evansella cellulosilytica (strain ATCC 21833 / DSM 2522 / FERM P-1141 / JCM 9156 / N-4) TaxID=649639 RepID=E6U2D9_EVAC2|nr:YuzD family protein [Evansella cellulosilytica]ADU31652.1 Uncharacterized conserved protein UCP010603 [Evansella cellulosilytica DSM 2522]